MEIVEQCNQIILGLYSQYSCGYFNSNRNTQNVVSAQLAKFEHFKELLRFNEGSKILDFGCGFGGFIKYLREAKINAIGVESNLKRLNFLKEEGVNVESGLESLQDGSLDIIFCIESLEYLSDSLPNYFAHFRRLLCNDGKILIQCQHKNAATDSFKSVRAAIMTRRMISSPLAYPKRDEISNLAKIANFTIEYEKKIDQSFYPLTIMNWLKNIEINIDKILIHYSEKEVAEFRNIMEGLLRSYEDNIWCLYHYVLKKC